MKNLQKPKSLLAFTVAAALSTGTGAYAQSGVLEEIVVTAQKRQQNLQDVPIAITAFNQTMIERVGGNTL